MYKRQALFAGRFITNEEILRGAFDVMMAGADSVLTPRSFDVVEMLAKEGMQVQGHVGMVPSMSTKYGGIRTVGKTSDEAIIFYGICFGIFGWPNRAAHQTPHSIFS